MKRLGCKKGGTGYWSPPFYGLPPEGCVGTQKTTGFELSTSFVISLRGKNPRPAGGRRSPPSGAAVNLGISELN